MELSKRTIAVAGLVTEGASVADIGNTRSSVWLAKRDPAVKLIAMDVNEGPLERAREHVLSEGLADRIELRLSDGFSALKPGEVHTIIAAGMGGGLVIHILEAHPAVTASVKEFVLQPQSEIERVRAYLEREGCTIVREEMVEEEGKYYPMMKAVHAGEIRPWSRVELLYGRDLLERRHPVLREYLLRERRIREDIRKRLLAAGTPGNTRSSVGCRKRAGRNPGGAGWSMQMCRQRPPGNRRKERVRGCFVKK